MIETLIIVLIEALIAFGLIVSAIEIIDLFF
jgi:hypothetical protein